MSEETYNWDDGTDPGGDDSGVQHEPVVDPGIFQVYRAGSLTVVGFRGHDIPAGFWIGGYRDALKNIIKEYECEELAFDFTGVTTVPSGLLGLFVSLGDLGVKISLYNPSGDVREVLDATSLNDMVEIHTVEVDANGDE